MEALAVVVVALVGVAVDSAIMRGKMSVQFGMSAVLLAGLIVASIAV